MHPSSILIFDDKKITSKLETYYTSCLRALSWVETDPKKFEKIVSKFLKTKYVHEKNVYEVLSKVIFSFYYVRKQCSNRISDDEIITSIYNVYMSLQGMDIETLIQRTVQYWQMRGINIDE